MKTFVIAVEEHEESWEGGQRSCALARSHGYDAEVFSAFTGTTGAAHFAQRGITQKTGFTQHKPGEIGCIASHHALWERCVSLGEPVIILEHDALMLRPWPEPQWQDVLHLNWRGSIVRRTRWELARQRDIYAPVQENSVYRHEFRPYDFPGFVAMSTTFGYAIKPHAAQKLLDDALNDGYLYADRMMREPVIHIETIHPAIAEEDEVMALGVSLTS